MVNTNRDIVYAQMFKENEWWCEGVRRGKEVIIIKTLGWGRFRGEVGSWFGLGMYVHM